MADQNLRELLASLWTFNHIMLDIVKYNFPLKTKSKEYNILSYFPYKWGIIELSGREIQFGMSGDDTIDKDRNYYIM